MSEFPFPQTLAWEVSREAVIVYLYALIGTDPDGMCRGVYRYTAHSGLSREEIEKALDELAARGYAERKYTAVPMALLGNGSAVMTNRRDLLLLGYIRPLLQDRLSPEAWAELRLQIFERDSFTCRYCGAKGVELECDHVEPISRGGTNEPGNLVTACSDCNRSKRNKQLDQWRQRAST